MTPLLPLLLLASATAHGPGPTEKSIADDDLFRERIAPILGVPSVDENSERMRQRMAVRVHADPPPDQPPGQRKERKVAAH